MTMVTSEGGAGLAAINYDDAEIQNLIRDQIAKGASDMEFKLFIEQCRFTGLNPLMGQIHCVPRYDGKLRRDVFKAQTGIDGFRLIAKRSHEYAGQDEPEWCGADGQWTDVWPTKTTPPVAARVRVYHHDYQRPIVGIVMWDEFVPTYTKNVDGVMTKLIMPMWKEKPAHMLAKCAEAQALRKAFPNELSGLYTDDEMARADAIARRAQRRQGTTTTAAAPTTPAPEGGLRPPPAQRDTTGEDIANADELNEFRAKLKTLQAADGTTTNALIEAWRESGVPPLGAITTAQDLIDAKVFVATFLSTYDPDAPQDDPTDGENVDGETGEIIEDDGLPEAEDHLVTQDAEVIETPPAVTGDGYARDEPERDEDPAKGLADPIPKPVQEQHPDEGEGHMISPRQLRKIRAMFAKATLRGDLEGDVHDYAASLTGTMAPLESLKNLTSPEASTVIRALDELERPKE